MKNDKELARLIDLGEITVHLDRKGGRYMFELLTRDGLAFSNGVSLVGCVADTHVDAVDDVLSRAAKLLPLIRKGK